MHIPHVHGLCMGFQARTVHDTIPASTMDSIFAYIHAYSMHHTYMVYAWDSRQGPYMTLSLPLPWTAYLLTSMHIPCITRTWSMHGIPDKDRT